MTGTDISTKAKILLLDEAGIRVLAAELLNWINLGQKELVVLKPNALVVTSAVQLTAGTKQELPAGGLVVIDVTRNMGTNGTTPGKVIVSIEKEMLDTINPDWHSATAVAAPGYLITDPRTPKVYYVYPPSTGTGYVELVCSVTPTAITDLANTLVLDDIYEGALLDYVLHRAYSKDADNAANMGRAQAHYQSFVTAVGGKIQGEAANIKKKG